MNKFNKGKTLGIVAASLASVALVGVGFSTWIIGTTQGATTDSSISVTVADTKDYSVVISNAKVDGKNNSVKFDAQHTKKGTNSILSCGDKDTEDLSFAITYDVKVGTDVQNWGIMAAIVDTSGKFKTAVDNRKYIELPSTLGIGTGVKCLDQSSTTNTSSGLTVGDKSPITVTQEFTFKWGAAFNNKNPVEVVVNEDIWTGSASEKADAPKLTKNTKDMKDLNLPAFTIQLSVGTVTHKASSSI